MEVSARLNHLHMAPRKVRLVADLVRGKEVVTAQQLLRFTNKGAAAPVLKLVNSAVANAKHNEELEVEQLYIKRILVSEGPKMKRWRPWSRAQVRPIQKKTSHITLVLDELNPTEKPKKKAKKETPQAAPKAAAPQKESATEQTEETVAAVPEKKQTYNKGRGRHDKKQAQSSGLRKVFRRKSV